MQKRKKIAFVGNTSFSIYNFRMGVIRSLMKEYEVVVLAPKDEYTPFFDREGIRYIEINIDCKGTNIMHDVSFMRQLHSIYKQEAFDLVFHYTIKPVIYGSLVCRKLGIRSIAITTGLGYTFRDHSLINSVVKCLYRISLKSVSEVWFLNQDDRRIFVEYNIVSAPKTFVLNGEGVDTDYYCPMQSNFNDGKFRFLLLSRLLYDKGIIEYAKAAQMLKKKYPNVEFRLLGKAKNDTPENIPQSMIDEWTEGGYINYLGETLDVRPIIADSDCVVLPSYYREGIPRCLMEAMSMEKPIITTDNVGCVELIVNNVNGLMCKPKSVSDLAEKMETMLNHPKESRERIGRAGRNIILQKYDEKIIIQQYHDKLNRILGE